MLEPGHAGRSDIEPDQPAHASEAPEPAASEAGPHGRPPFRSAAIRFGLIGILAAIAFWLTYAGFVLTEAGQRIENQALLGAALREPADRQESLGHLSAVSLSSMGLALVALFGVAFLRRRFGLAALAAVVVLVSVGSAELLQLVLPRPALLAGPAWILRNSFPSGHTAAAASIAMAALLIAPDRLRWLALPLGAAFAAAIGQATQIAGWHRLSGSIGSIALAVAVASVSIAVLARLGQVRPSTHGGINARLLSAHYAVAAAVLVLAVTVALLPAAFPVLRAPEGASDAFAHTAFDLVGIGLTILTFALFARAIEPYSFGRAARSGPTSSDRSDSAPEG